MELHPAHFVAVVGGAAAGSEAAHQLAERGIYAAVFEQNTCPYGKIDDGLPKWHIKLREKEREKINNKLNRPGVFFIPNTKIGRDIEFLGLLHNWGFSSILLANGAWKDRRFPVEGIDRFIGKGFYYQNPFVYWFNHYHEKNYNRESIKVSDRAIVIGGGLASFDVLKILMLETVTSSLERIGIRIDTITLEQKSISAVLNENKLTLGDLGLHGCTLFYRKRKQDMPLAQIPPGASREKIEKVYQSREKIFNNFQNKNLFNFKERSIPTGLIVENEKLVGMKFKLTKVENGEVTIQHDKEYEVRSPLIISSIGSVPEPIPGIKMKGELYDIVDSDSGQLNQFDQVFALGNVVTGKGNIRASLTHGKLVSGYVMDHYLAWSEEDYQELLDHGALDAKLKTEKISGFLSNKKLLSSENVKSIYDKIVYQQKKVGYDGDYSRWVNSNS